MIALERKEFERRDAHHDHHHHHHHHHGHGKKASKKAVAAAKDVVAAAEATMKSLASDRTKGVLSQGSKRSRHQFQEKIRALDAAEQEEEEEAEAEPAGDGTYAKERTKMRTTKVQQRKRAALEKKSAGGQDVGIGSAALDEALYDEDGDAVLAGQKVGDAYAAMSSTTRRVMDDKLNSIAEFRMTEGLGTHHLPVAQGFKAEYSTIPPDFCPPSVSSAFEASSHPHQRRRPNLTPLLQHVPVALRQWLTSLSLYETIETRYLVPIYLGRSRNLPAGHGLNLIKVANYVEATMAIDLDAVAFTYYRAQPRDHVHWAAEYTALRVLNETGMRLPPEVLQTLVCCFDFNMDEKQMFRLRLVYVIASLTAQAELNSELAASRAATPGVELFLNHSSPFGSAINALSLTPEANLSTMKRSEFYQSQASGARSTFGESGSMNVTTSSIFSPLGAYYAGHYYHTPEEAETAQDVSVRRTIHREFVITNPLADKS
jgi:hypothetical protein